MKFVKKGEYLKNYGQAAEALVLMWQSPELKGFGFAVIKTLITIVGIPVMLLCCIVGVHPDA